MNRQLLLDFGTCATPTFENFVVGDNSHGVALVGAIQTGGAEYPYLHLWGGPGCGKTHLLRALVKSPRTRYVDCNRDDADTLVWDSAVDTWAVDHIESANQDAQLALFHLINQLRGEPGAAIVTAGRSAPIHLAVREDLRTRLGWGVVLQIHALNDIDSEAALASYARTRGLALGPDVGHYLLTRFRRDMPSLVALIDTLDRYALEQQRLLTLPLVREWLQQEKTN